VKPTAGASNSGSIVPGAGVGSRPLILTLSRG